MKTEHEVRKKLHEVNGDIADLELGGGTNEECYSFSKVQKGILEWVLNDNQESS
ncbi:hypothetical protein LCGC14_2019610 [marine sediment metagenome]|uniref:Uncharacterized protein n=1 Tax=marine sediment metagenome TaxID=412755 RepID=A0A0F9EY66_9ZZZZ